MGRFTILPFREAPSPPYGRGLMTDRLSRLHWKDDEMAYLEITLQVDGDRRNAAAEVYKRFRAAFLESVPGARSKELLVRDEDVQVLHQFGSVAEANAYLGSSLFAQDVVGALIPLLSADPEIRVYEAA
jgi:hypothetical protein